MKTNLLRTLALLAPLGLLTGCVGYNTALFMTKSNVGLDLDAKPPTAEINISRKEGVVEPSFEGGQTPPVMASFSTKVGHDKLDSFFLGVNQTFAGGDAAVTMAKLFDDTNSVFETDSSQEAVNKAKFNSGLTLSEPPKANSKPGFLGWRKRLFGLAKPGEVRPFFFGTDTQFGMKVAWNGVGGPYPDTVKLGFNRKEIALAPLTISDNNEVRIPSFLATVDSAAKGTIVSGTNALGVKQEVNWLQYFATGKSADYLARQYGVRKAMLERADPKSTTESERLKQADKNLKDQQIRGIVLAGKVATEVDRIELLDSLPGGVPASVVPPATQPASPQLDRALDALTNSGLFDASSYKGEGAAKTITIKVKVLKEAALDIESQRKLRQLETYLNSLTNIK